MKKLHYKTESSIPLFKDKDVNLEKPLSERDLDKHMRKLKKMNKLYDELLRDLPEISEL